MKMLKTYIISAIFLFLLFTPVQAAEKSFGRGIKIREEARSNLQQLENDMAPFSVLVDVDRKDRVYHDGDRITVSIKTSQDGYLYLLHFTESGEETILIPNKYQKNNAIKAGQKISYPAPNSGFRFDIVPPFGRETIKAFVTTEQMQSFDSRKFTQAPATPLDGASARSLTRELARSKSATTKSLNFATHEVSYDVRSKNDTTPISKGKRFAVCIGVGKYRDRKISPLVAASKDAFAMANLFTEYCGVNKDDCSILTDESVTLPKLKRIFCDELPEITNPDDIVFVYWSGHGGLLPATAPATSGQGGVMKNVQQDYISFLMPYDSDTNDPRNTTLLEDPFGQWVQKLNGRKLFFILDACYSGGMVANARTIAEKPVFTFGVRRFARSRSLGQQDLAVLASSTSGQESWERGEKDLSVMTYYLIDMIKKGSSRMTHKDLKMPLRRSVDKYVRENRLKTQQTVVEQDDLSPGLILKP